LIKFCWTGGLDCKDTGWNEIDIGGGGGGSGLGRT